MLKRDVFFTKFCPIQSSSHRCDHAICTDVGVPVVDEVGPWDSCSPLISELITTSEMSQQKKLSSEIGGYVYIAKSITRIRRCTCHLFGGSPTDLLSPSIHPYRYQKCIRSPEARMWVTCSASARGGPYCLLHLILISSLNSLSLSRQNCSSEDVDTMSSLFFSFSFIFLRTKKKRQRMHWI